MRRLAAFATIITLVLTACVAEADDQGPVDILDRDRVADDRIDPDLPVILAGDLQAFDACDDFLDHVTTQALELVGPWGLQGPGYYGPELVFSEEAPVTTAAAAAGDDSGARLQAGTDYSGTNVQVAGVDEPDVVKTDGRRIVAVSAGRLYVVEVDDGDPRLAGSVRLPDGWDHQILLEGDRALIVANAGFGVMDAITVDRGIAPAPVTAGVVTLTEVTLEEDPEIVRTLKMDGTHVSSRMIDGTVRIVVRSAPTGLSFVYPEGGGLRSERAAEAENRRVIEESTIENWLPYYVAEEADGTVREGTLVDCERTYHPEAFSGLGMLNVVTVDLAEGLEPLDTVAVMVSGETVYASPNSLYVASARWIDWSLVMEEGRQRDFDDFTTQIHKFDISDPRAAEYRGSGEVTGYLLNQFAMDEADGYLRVASTSDNPWWGSQGESESFVTVLAEDDGELRPVGRVGDLGRGERIYAVRFMGDVGYVVTFRQTDPLYTLDLSNPEDPAVMGELKILGYSAYLHPLGDGLLLGVGQDADRQGRVQGTQIAVFDVSDLTEPVRVHKLTISDSNSEVEWDHRAFLYWAPTETAVLPLTRWAWDDVTGESFFAGALAVDVDVRRGLTELGRITHQTDEEIEQGWYDGTGQIRRSLVIGDTLFTMSDRGIQANDLDTMAERAFVDFRGGPERIDE